MQLWKHRDLGLVNSGASSPSSPPPPPGHLSKQGLGKMGYWWGGGCGRGLLPDPQLGLCLSSRSITKVTISPRFHGEIDSSRECGLEDFSCDFSCPVLLPLPAGQG